MTFHANVHNTHFPSAPSTPPPCYPRPPQWAGETWMDSSATPSDETLNTYLQNQWHAEPDGGPLAPPPYSTAQIEAFAVTSNVAQTPHCELSHGIQSTSPQQHLASSRTGKWASRVRCVAAKLRKGYRKLVLCGSHELEKSHAGQ